MDVSDDKQTNSKPYINVTSLDESDICRNGHCRQEADKGASVAADTLALLHLRTQR